MFQNNVFELLKCHLITWSMESIILVFPYINAKLVMTTSKICVYSGSQ